MIDISTIEQYSIPRPDPNFIGTAAEFDQLPPTHQEQILFLDKEAEKFLFRFLSEARLITGGFWDPFAKGNFKTVETFDRFYGIQASKQDLKKWLYSRSIPFSTRIFILPGAQQPPLLTTWKMMTKYVEHIFFGDDVVVFDPTLNWCLLYWHENEMFFGKDKYFDPAEDKQMMEELNQRKQQYPRFKHPFL
jgi:hypothetical protein